MLLHRYIAHARSSKYAREPPRLQPASPFDPYPECNAKNHMKINKPIQALGALGNTFPCPPPPAPSVLKSLSSNLSDLRLPCHEPDSAVPESGVTGLDPEPVEEVENRFDERVGGTIFDEPVFFRLRSAGNADVVLVELHLRSLGSRTSRSGVGVVLRDEERE